MSDVYWVGLAAAAAQVSEAGIDTFDATTTYGITIGGVTVSVAGITDEETTTDALVVALNLSTDAGFAAITWDRNGATSSSTIRGTADVAGTPFTFTTYANAGTGDWTAVSDTVPSADSNHWNSPDNWSTGAVPVSSDDVYVDSGSISIIYGLDQSAVTLDSLTIKKTFTGKIGDGTNYLQIGATLADIGEHYGPGAPLGSSRIMLDLGSAVSTITVHSTAVTSADLGMNAVRLLMNNASSALYVREARGGVGITTGVPGETSTIGIINVDVNDSRSSVQIGPGTTLTTYSQRHGNNVMEAAATVTTVTVDDGSLYTYGDYTITTMNANGGTIYQGNTKTAGDCVTTLNLYAGKVDATKGGAARTIGTLVLSNRTGSFSASSSVAITSITEPTDRYKITMAGA